NVIGEGAWVAVSANAINTCGVTTDAYVYCWGDNTYFQLGDPDFTGEGASTPNFVPGLTGATDVSVGFGHACALDGDGLAYCWGNNGAGQLGIGTEGDQKGAYPVASDLRFVSIAAGHTHTCAITTDFDMYCWGDNTYGQLGNGEAMFENSKWSPELVSG